MIVFDKFNPIKKTSHSTKENYLKVTEKIPTLKNLILVYKHAEQENRFGSESKIVTEKDKAFVRALIDGDTKLFETLGKEIVNYCDAILNEKCTYTRDPKYKNMVPFFDALFDELKKDGLILYKYLPDLAASDSELKNNDELIELFRDEFVTWCKTKFPTNCYKRKVYRDVSMLGYVFETCTYSSTDEKNPDEDTYKQFDEYLRVVYDSVYEHFKAIKAKYNKQLAKNNFQKPIDKRSFIRQITNIQ